MRGKPFKKNNIPWNKGIRGRQPWQKFEHLQKYAGWNKGLTKEDPRVMKGALAKTGKKRPDMIGNKLQKLGKGNWRGGLTTIDKLERSKFRKTMQKLILKRDNYTCQLCGERGGDLQVDHIQSWVDYVDLRFSINNCRTLCKKCHYEITYKKPMAVEKPWGHNLKYYLKKGVQGL